jgi:dTMP kinase
LYVAFEGLNNCGKGTQIRLLMERLEREKIEAWQGREPGTTYLGEQLRNLLQIQQQEIPELPAEVAMLMAQRAQLIGREVKPRLAAGQIVVVDRSDGTSLAFQGVGRGVGLFRVAALNGYAVDQVHPDVVIYLSVPERILHERGKTAEEHDRFEHEADEFHVMCKRGYEEALRLDAQSPPQTWFAIDASGTPEAVHERVWEVVGRVVESRDH